MSDHLVHCDKDADFQNCLCSEEEIEALESERDKWKSEYENVCKFATDYEQQRDKLAMELKQTQGLLDNCILSAKSQQIGIDKLRQELESQYEAFNRQDDRHLKYEEELQQEVDRLKAELAKTSHEMWNDKRERAEMLESRDAWKAKYEEEQMLRMDWNYRIECLEKQLAESKARAEKLARLLRQMYGHATAATCDDSMAIEVKEALADYAKATEGKGL